MKKLLSLVMLFAPLATRAQGELGIAVGSSYLIGAPKNVDVLTRGTAIYAYSMRFKIKGAWSAQPWLQLSNSRYIMDGVFSKTHNQYAFGLSPDSFKQSYLTLYSVRVPLMIRYNFSTYNNPMRPQVIKENSFAFGPYVDYIVSAKQQYKIGERKFKEDAMIENKLTWGVTAEITALRGKRNGGSGFSASLGMAYQLSEYLSQAHSYKPLLVYVRLGMGGIKRKN